MDTTEGIWGVRAPTSCWLGLARACQLGQASPLERRGPAEALWEGREEQPRLGKCPQEGTALG